MTYTHAIVGLDTPDSLVTTVAWDQRFGRRLFFKAGFVFRDGSHDAVVDPDRAAQTLTLSSKGESKYWEFETTGRYLGAENRDLTVSFVRSHSTRDLNDYDAHFGNFKDPLIRPNQHSLSPTDVPNRIIVRGSQGLPWKMIFVPLFEWRSGFPWTAVDEYQDFVGERNRTGRLPTVDDLRLLAGAAVAVQEVPLHRRAQGLQHLQQRRRARHPDQHHGAGLRARLQPDPALDRHHLRLGPALTAYGTNGTAGRRSREWRTP